MGGNRREDRVAPSTAPDSRAALWPDGRAVAVWPVVNIEHFLPGRAGPAIQPHLVRGLDIANASWRRYGERSGVWRLLRLFAELGLPATAALDAEVCRLRPGIVEAVIDAGWDVLAHGWENSTPHHGMERHVEKDRIARTLDTLAAATGRPISGWLTPGFAVSEVTQELLVETGVRYTADWADSDAPSWLQTPAGRLLAVPYGLETNDISLVLSLHHTAAAFAEALIDHVAELCEEPPAGAVVALGLHPYLAGQPGRVRHLRHALERMAALPGAWFCTGREIAERSAAADLEVRAVPGSSTDATGPIGAGRYEEGP
jgi:peptidoglycan/xylan/chitin deacetylase (PgdA/CDA1 family)